MSSLVVEDLTAAYGASTVLSGVSLRVEAGGLTCVLGANGAGKTTTVKCVMGLLKPTSGRVWLGDREVTGRPTHERVAEGVTCIPEGRRVFPKLTVEENLRAGAYVQGNARVVKERLARVNEIFPRLFERRSQLAGTMSGGEQSMISIGRALMSDPRVLIVDEPSLGLAPALVKETFEIIDKIKREGVTVLLIEQNVRQTLAISDYGYVIAQGHVVAEGDTEALRDNEEIARAYFGRGEDG